MDYQFQIFLELLYEILRDFYHSNFVLGIKIIIGIYTVVLFLDIVMLLILRDVRWHLRVGLRGMDLPLSSKRKLKFRWHSIKKRLSTKKSAEFKIAIIEADSLVDEILEKMGYKGANMTEKLEQIEYHQIEENFDALQSAHEIRNRIINEENFSIDEDLAEDTVKSYENFLKYIEFLD